MVNTVGLVAIAGCLTIGICALVTAWAERAMGVAAINAMVHKEELFGKGLIMTVIPETIVIFGLVIAILIIGII